MIKKSVYSLVLADDLVRAVDRLAYMQHTSRSNLINQILAEHLSLSTPEMRMREILSRMEQIFDTSNSFQIALRPTDSQMALRSSISYKYNPTVHYSVVLYRNAGNCFGELRVAFRTRNVSLINMLTDFFKLWVQIENSYFARLFPTKQLSYDIQPGKFTRALMLPDNASLSSDDSLGDAVARYVRLFDSMLKLYFENPTAYPAHIQSEYLAYLRSGVAII